MEEFLSAWLERIAEMQEKQFHFPLYAKRQSFYGIDREKSGSQERFLCSFMKRTQLRYSRQNKHMTIDVKNRKMNYYLNQRTVKYKSRERIELVRNMVERIEGKSH